MEKKFLTLKTTTKEHLKEAISEAIKIAKRNNQEVKLILTDVEIYVRKYHKVKELLKVYSSFYEKTSLQRKRVITDIFGKVFRKIEIFGITSVKGTFDPKKSWIGYIAKDNKNRTYLNNWYSAPDDSLTPYAQWICKEELENKEGIAFWWDVIWSCYFFDKRQEIARRFKNIFKYCKKHNELFYKDEKCIFCQLGISQKL